MTAKLDPTIVIGTKMMELKNKNFRVGESNYLIVEACEYKKSFLNLEPNLLIITNIEAEHLDYYKNLKNYLEAFKKLSGKLNDEGTIIINAEDKNSLKVIKDAEAQLIKFTTKSKKGDFYLEGKDLVYKNTLLGINRNLERKIKIHPKVKGKFNIINASFAAIAGFVLGIDEEKIEKGIGKFHGTWRRMQIKSFKLGKTVFIDDYAHHPTEIEVTLTTIRDEHPKAKILCVFQPHQYSRTKILLKQFGECFNDVDKVIIPNIYKVRDTEEDVKSVSTDDLVKEIKKHKVNAVNGNGLEKTAKYIKNNHSKYDIIVTMGAGDIERIYGLF